ILALIGGVLALAVVAGLVYLNYAVNAEVRTTPTEWREALLRSMPDTDLRADFEVLTEWPWDKDAIGEFEALSNRPERDAEKTALETEKQKRLHTLPVLTRAVSKFPNSLRLQLRVGTLGEEQQRPAALRRAAQLDQQNPLPLYLLASEAASRGSLDEALSLVKEGNRRRWADWYPMPTTLAGNQRDAEIIASQANSPAHWPTYFPIRRLAVSLSKHAGDLYKAGRGDKADEIVGQVRAMGWRVAGGNQANLMDLLIGRTIVGIANKNAKEAYVSTGDKAHLAELGAENRRVVYVDAGARAQIDSGMEKLVRRVEMFTAYSVPVEMAGAALALIIFASLIWWGILALRSRRKAASEIHTEATARAFSARKLLKVYALVAAVLAVETVALVYCASALEVRLLTVVEGSAMVLPAILMLGVLVWASIAYKRAYRQAAESAGETISKPWKGYPVADKRERQRRLTGVFGGVMAAIAVWGILVSGYMKVTMDAFPWQVERATAGLRQEEPKYVRDLLAGTVKVPEKYIRE
ncbi:MAG: hypothetical protein NTU88_13170, partial [Armatimonadetes bacterium]|nr:hypothetical protein [Armatimonadota bacterium]